MATPIDPARIRSQWPSMVMEIAAQETMQIQREAWDALLCIPFPRPTQNKTLLTHSLAMDYLADCEKRRQAGQAAIQQAVRILLGLPDHRPV